MRSRLARWFVTLPPTLFLWVFFVAPGVIIALASLRYPGEYGGLAPLVADGRVQLTLETYQFFFSDFIYTWIFLKSFAFAFVTTLACVVLAYPLAWKIVHARRRHRDLMLLLAILPFASNFLIRVYAWMIILGPQAMPSVLVNTFLGWLGHEPVSLLYSSFAVLVGMVYVHLPFMILPLHTNLERHDPVLLDAARDLGATPWQSFWRITWPLSLPGVLAGSVLVFIPVLGVFAIPEILGGTGDILIGNLIKEQFLATRDWPFGSALSMLLTGAVLVVAWVGARAARRLGGRYA